MLQNIGFDCHLAVLGLEFFFNSDVEKCSQLPTMTDIKPIRYADYVVVITGISYDTLRYFRFYQRIKKKFWVGQSSFDQSNLCCVSRMAELTKTF